MSSKIYELNEDGTIVYFNDEPMELIDVVARLNQLTYTKMKLKKGLFAKDDLCDAYEKKHDELTKTNKVLGEKIIELQNKLNDYELKCNELDINYWRGIEKAYADLLDKYHSKIIELEKENFRLFLRIEDLEDDML